MIILQRDAFGALVLDQQLDNIEAAQTSKQCVEEYQDCCLALPG